MKIITFHLRGKMAHFRRYYSNSSALTYTIPPRTTAAGIIAGLAGLKRDSYYRDFSLDNCHIAVAVRAPVKKTVQKLNYLMIDSLNNLNGSAEHHSQTATEFIIPHNIRTGMIDYQIWVHHRDPALMSRLEALTVGGGTVYLSRGIALGLGTAFNLGWIENGRVIAGEVTQEDNHPPISSVIPAKNITGILADQMEDDGYRLIKEEVPLEFDEQRCITPRGLGNMVINLGMKPVPAAVKSCVITETGEAITWME